MKHHRVDQNTERWMQLRCGIPTASCASSLVTSTGKLSESLTKYAKHLAMEVYTGKPMSDFSGTKSTQRGHELEPVAADWYAFKRNAEPEICGFFTDDLERYGASPDRTIGDDGLLEIKCQESSGHFDTLMAYQNNRKTPSAYYSQAQMELLVSERKWLDLVLFHPDLPSTIITILPNAEFHRILKLQITACTQKRDEYVKQLQEIAA